MKKILLIDDDPMTQKALREKLSKLQYRVYTAMDGKEGLKVAIKEKPDIILLDLVMPVMDGMTMLEKLRQNSWGKTANVIILSNLSDAEKVSEAVKRGAFDYLVKVDWKLEDVVKKIKDKIGE